MNKNKQSANSIIFETCWLEDGATTDQVKAALVDAGFENDSIMSKCNKVMKNLVKRGQLYKKSDKWFVEQDPKPRTFKRKNK